MQAQALQLLRQALADKTATFRDGQWQAISALVERRARLLVVQRTGWGKSLVVMHTIGAKSGEERLAPVMGRRDDAGAVASEHLSDRCTDATGGAGHDGDLAAKRPFPVGRWRGVGRPEIEDLAVDVSRLRRQDEPHGGFQARHGWFGVRRQVHQRHRRAAPQLLAE